MLSITGPIWRRQTGRNGSSSCSTPSSRDVTSWGIRLHMHRASSSSSCASRPPVEALGNVSRVDLWPAPSHLLIQAQMGSSGRGRHCCVSSHQACQQVPNAVSLDPASHNLRDVNPFDLHSSAQESDLCRRGSCICGFDSLTDANTTPHVAGGRLLLF